MELPRRCESQKSMNNPLMKLLKLSDSKFAKISPPESNFNYLPKTISNYNNKIPSSTASKENPIHRTNKILSDY